MMGLGPGSGSRSTRVWLPRLVLLAALAALALFAHGHGTHSGTRTFSYLAILGLLLLRFVARARRRPSRSLRDPGRGRGTGGRIGTGGPFWGAGFWGAGSTGPDGTRAGPAPAAPRAADADAATDRPAARWPPPSPGSTPVDSPVAGPHPPEP